MTQKQINKANELRDAGKTNEAKKILIPLLKSKDYQVAVNAHSALGICYANENNFSQAIKYYKKAYGLSEKNNWKERLGGIARDIAIVYKNAKKYKDSEKWMLRSIELIKKYFDEGQGVNASLGITYSKLGLLYTQMKKYTKAKNAFVKAFQYLSKSDHAYWKLIAGIDKSEFLIASKKYKQAKEELEKLISAAICQNKEYKLIEALILLGDSEKGLKNKTAAKMFYNLADLTLKIFDSPQVIKKFRGEIDKRLKK